MEEKPVFFFDQPDNTTALKRFERHMQETHTNGDFETARNSHIQTIVCSMATRPEEWSRDCEINIEWIGKIFINRLVNDNNTTKEQIDSIFAMCFRFLFERYLSIKSELSTEFEDAKKFALSNIDKFEAAARDHIEWAIREMPIMMFKAIANSDSIRSIKDFNEISRIADGKRDRWNVELAERENRVDALKAELNKCEGAFNFVGLFQGFDELSKEKEGEKKAILFALRIFGFIVVLPLIVEIVIIYLNYSDLTKVKELALLSLVPTVSLVAIFIYYFRVLLLNYRSTKSQLLQIELRKTLCRFIQHYAEYSSKLKQQDKDALSKFENIIFSGIVSDDEKLPSTYDGMEQLVNLIKLIKH